MKFLMLALGGLLITLQGLSNCPDRNAKDNFDGSAFSGTWYVVRAVRPPPRMQSRCTHVVVTQTRGDDLGLSTRFYSNVISQYSTFSGVLRRVEHSSRNAKFIYTRPGLYSEESARYTIMDTDYTNYAVVSFCASSKRSEVAFLMSRNKSLDTTRLAEAEKSMPEGLKYVTLNHTDCPAYE